MPMEGVSRSLSLTVDGSLTNASLGAVSGEVVEVTHNIPSGFTALVATQPAGSAGAVTPSKCSLNMVNMQGGVAVAVAVGFGVVEGGALGVGVAPAPDVIPTSSKCQ